MYCQTYHSSRWTQCFQGLVAEQAPSPWLEADSNSASRWKFRQFNRKALSQVDLLVCAQSVESERRNRQNRKGNAEHDFSSVPSILACRGHYILPASADDILSDR